MLKVRANIFFQKWLIVPLLAVVCFVLTEIADKNPEFIERNYSQKLYPFLANLLSQFSAVFPFSLDDLFYMLLGVFLLSIIVLFILRKLKFSQALKSILNLLATVYILFYTSWGFNYYRPNLPVRLNLAESKVEKQQFISIFEQLIKRTNHSYCSFQETNKNKVDSLLEKSYQNLSEVLKINYPMGKRPDKKITFSSFYAKSGITGYFGPFFNEVHVNKKVLPLEYPFILAHEKAHQLGITSEAEANFYAWMVCNYSTSQELHYSANLIILRHFLIQAYEMAEYKNLTAKIDTNVKADINSIQKHWLALRNTKMDKAASKVNDAYLKTNKVKGGIKDYQGVVQHVMNFSLDSTFQNKHNLLPK